MCILIHLRRAIHKHTQTHVCDCCFQCTLQWFALLSPTWVLIKTVCESHNLVWLASWSECQRHMKFNHMRRILADVGVWQANSGKNSAAQLWYSRSNVSHLTYKKKQTDFFHFGTKICHIIEWARKRLMHLTFLCILCISMSLNMHCEHIMEWKCQRIECDLHACSAQQDYKWYLLVFTSS